MDVSAIVFRANMLKCHDIVVTEFDVLTTSHFRDIAIHFFLTRHAVLPLEKYLPKDQTFTSFSKVF